MKKEQKRKIVDQHTVADWPIEIHDSFAIPLIYQKPVLDSFEDNIFDNYVVVFAPACRMIKESRDYLFVYGQNEVVYFYQDKNAIKQINIKRDNILKIIARKELLDAEIIVEYHGGQIVFPYVPSSYYLYDPFLNWLMGLDKDFMPVIEERKNPRPRSLYHESLTMFNYSLSAYRLGSGFKEYSYNFEKRRKKWMPWKSSLEEWLDIVMERGSFHLYSFEYLTECIYIPNEKRAISS